MAKNSLFMLAMKNVYEERCKCLEELCDKRTENRRNKLAEIEALHEQLKNRRAEHTNAKEVFKAKMKEIENRHEAILDLKRSLVNVQTSNKEESERPLDMPYQQKDMVPPKKEGRSRKRAIRTATSLRYVEKPQDGSNAYRKLGNLTAHSDAVGPIVNPSR